MIASASKDETVIVWNMEKIKSNLSNKAWDKGIKGLTKNGLALVSKTENKLLANG